MPCKRVYDPHLSVQQNIARLWPRDLALATERLCTTCRDNVAGNTTPLCLHHLLPLTTEGRDCPYYTALVPPAPITEAPRDGH